MMQAYSRLGGRSSKLKLIVINYLLIILIIGLTHTGHNEVSAVSVQRLNVPDLVVIGQQQQQQNHPNSRFQSAPGDELRAARFSAPTTAARNQQQQPEAASLITSGQPQQGANLATNEQLITFECLISYDKRKDKNLIVKWHHDERNEPIYQWIPELNKRSIAPQYRAYIMPVASSSGHQFNQSAPFGLQPSEGAQHLSSSSSSASNNQTIEASFKLVRPTKELGGKYTCSAISAQNDDSKSKKMIVYTPPRNFSFNATRANLSALFASQRDRLIQLTQPTASLYPTSLSPASSPSLSSLPLAYRMRGLEPNTGSTISPQQIDYVNVNQVARFRSASTNAQSSTQQQYINNNNRPNQAARRFGLKLVCDIDQVFPVPEVSIFRLAKLDGPQAEKLPKLDTRIERDVHTGLFRIQVTSVLDDDELQVIRQNQLMAMMSSSSSLNSTTSSLQTNSEAEIYFECLIALTNLELSRYVENRRTLIYRPGPTANSQLQRGAQMSENMRMFDSQLPNSAPRFVLISQNNLFGQLLTLCLLCWTLILTVTHHLQVVES